jgi:hypothetical protein
MTAPVASQDPVVAIAEGGPMDGALLGDPTVGEFEVVAADRTKWRYVATSEMRTTVDGSSARIYRCAGRI